MSTHVRSFTCLLFQWSKANPDGLDDRKSLNQVINIIAKWFT